MRQLPQAVWSKIADQPEMKQETFKTLFRMTPESLDLALDEQAEKLARSGHEDKVILAYQTVIPLLLENQAISAYLIKTDDLALRQALPEIQTVNEALLVAQKEYRLTVKQNQSLQQLLSKTVGKSKTQTTQSQGESPSYRQARIDLEVAIDELGEILLGKNNESENVDEK